VAKSTGYIKDGKYYKDKLPNGASMQAGDSSQYKSWDHQRQRADHQYELIQPYQNGQPNPEFIEHYPQEAKNYGFVKGDI
jgi:hypothetical protein